MKKIIALVSLFVCVLTQANAQPTLNLTPGDGEIILRGNGGGITSAIEYDVYRGTVNPPTTLYTTIQDGYNYEWTDTDVENGTLYYYRVISRDASNNESIFSNVDAAVPVQGNKSYVVLDGVDDRIIRNFSNFATGLTKIEFKVRMDEAPSGKNIELLRINNNHSGGLENFNALRFYHAQSKLVIDLTINDWTAGPTTFQVVTKNIADGEWHTVAVANLKNTWTNAFVDGTQYSFGNSRNSIHFEHNTQMVVGGQSNGTTTYLKGAIDNIKTWGGNNLRNFWRFDEPAGTTAWDSGPRNNNMVKENGVATVTSPFGPLTAISYKDDSVSVRWNKDIDFPDETLQAYSVRRKAGNAAFGLLAIVSKEDTSFMDRSVTSGEIYEYEVRSLKSNSSMISSETDVVKPVDDFDRQLIVDGIGQVQIPDNELFPDANGTIEFWMKAADGDVGVGKSHSVLNKHIATGSQNGFNFILDRSTLYVQVKDNGVTNRNIRPTTPIALNDGNWHHVALTYNWGGTSILYIDGVARVTESNTPNVNLTTGPLRIGRSPASFWEPFVGSIDEVRIWDNVLTANEISTQMGQRVPGDAEGLLGVWRFDVPLTDGVAYDDGVSGYDATVLGNLKQSIEEVKHVSGSYNGTQVDLEWDFQLNSTITGFEVVREDLIGGSSPATIATLPATATSYIDANAQKNKEYQYNIRALTNENPQFASDVIVTRNDLGNMLYFGTNPGTVVLTEEVTNNPTGTIEFRFRASENPPAGKVYSMLNRHDNQGSDNGFNFTLSGTNLLVQFKESSTVTNLSHAANLIDGEWHHVALVYNWSGENKLFIDGVQQATATLSGLDITSNFAQIGRSVNTFWAPYEGQIDELRMWTKQLTGAEINASKNIRLPGNTADLGAVWHFDESSGGGTIAHDNGANNYNGFLSGDVNFWREPGALTFSSISNGFNESAGNNGAITGSMQIGIERNTFSNAGGIIPNNLFRIQNRIDLSPDPFNPILEDLISGLNPVMTVSADGKTANLIFNGNAVYHEGQFSTPALQIEFERGAFEEDYPIAGRTGADTQISYTLRDNILPTLVEPIPDVQLLVTSEPTQIELDNFFTDPDFGQQFQYLINKDNSFIFSSLNRSMLTVGVPETPGEGSTEITVTFRDNNGGEVSDAFVVSVVKLNQVITFPPIPDIDLATQNTVTLTAIANSNLPVQLALLSGDGSLSNGVLTINQSGTFQVSANQAGDDTFAPAAEVIQSFNVIDSRKDNQTITFTNDLSGLTYGDAAVNLTATASSNLDVSYNSTGPVQVNGSTVTITGAGAASVTAIQAGDGDYNPADPVTINFEIGKVSLTATADDQSGVFGEALPNYTIAFTGFLEGEDETVLDELPTASSTATVGSDAGTYAIMVSGGTDNNYAFTPVNGTLTIGKADQTITFSEISDRDIVTSSTVTLNASASSGLSVIYDLEGNGMIEGNTITLERTGTFVVTAIQSGNNNYNEAPRVTRTFLVTNSQKTNQTITFETIPDQEYGNEFTLEASATSNLAIDYRVISGLADINNGVLTLLGVGTVEIQAAQDGDDTFNPAPAITQQFTVGKAPLTVTADDKIIQAGQAIPELTFTYSGFRLNNDASFVDTPPTISTDATASSPGGTYAITLTGGSDFVYELVLVNGTLTIESALSVDETGLTIYPNPVVDQLQVKGRAIETMRLLSLDGKLIRSLDANTMDVSNLKQGNYILQLLERNGQVSNHRIIKK